MHSPTNRSWLARSASIAVALVIVWAPLSTSAQDAGAPAADSAALPQFLQSALRDFAPPAPRVLAARAAAAINTAIAALNAKKYADARAAMGELRLDRLSPYELGMAERLLFHVAYAEEKLAEARQHLVNAVESGGLTEREVAECRTDIERIDARLGAIPPG